MLILRTDVDRGLGKTTMYPELILRKALVKSINDMISSYTGFFSCYTSTKPIRPPSPHLSDLKLISLLISAAQPFSFVSAPLGPHPSP